MKRRSIFAMLATALTAAAQQFKGEPPEPDWRQCADPKDYPLSCGKKLARNNQCPVCATMAEPYSKPRRLAQLQESDPICQGAGKETCAHMKPEELPDSRLVRCRRCDAAFWQDAEEKRK